MPPFIKYGNEFKEQRPFGRSPQKAELKRGENSPVDCFQWETYVRGFFLETSVFMHSASNAYLCLQSERPAGHRPAGRNGVQYGAYLHGIVHNRGRTCPPTEMGFFDSLGG